MTNFLNGKWLNLINTISQVVTAISAVVAIVIAIKQTLYKGKINIKGYYTCGLGMIEYNESKELEVVSGISVKVINLGLFRFVIEYYGIKYIMMSGSKPQTSVFDYVFVA